MKCFSDVSMTLNKEITTSGLTFVRFYVLFKTFFSNVKVKLLLKVNETFDTMKNSVQKVNVYLQT